ncbi:MAG TPA: rod-binding protein [Treponemataceae bacterium]|nr:rod-binding protein [Treponemataceae bacterium]
MSETMLTKSITGAGFSSSLNILANNAKAGETERKFSALIDGIQSGMDTPKEKASLPAGLSSSSISNDPRLPGDFISSFALTAPTDAERHAQPVGAAANSGQKGTIDKGSKLYEQALELESYIVKIMLSSMKNTVSKSTLGGDESFASGMYNDMFYDELSRNMTKNAGFGLADQVYLQLSGS